MIKRKLIVTYELEAENEVAMHELVGMVRAGVTCEPELAINLWGSELTPGLGSVKATLLGTTVVEAR